MSASPKQRMIVSAALLMRERGVEATSFSDVLQRSGAPRGSIYHHFPGGKAQLIAEATEYAGEFTARGLAAALASDDPIGGVKAFADTWAATLKESDFGAGCPVVAASLESDRTPGARAAAGSAFARWEAILADGLARTIPEDRARSLATMIVASIEGAVVIARAQRSVEPVERVARELERALAGAHTP